MSGRKSSTPIIKIFSFFPALSAAPTAIDSSSANKTPAPRIIVVAHQRKRERASRASRAPSGSARAAGWRPPSLGARARAGIIYIYMHVYHILDVTMLVYISAQVANLRQDMEF
jgi:hypothetical protein